MLCIAPAVGFSDVAEAKTACAPVTGFVKFTRLNKLKASARNSALSLSPILVVLKIERSTARRFGPVKMFFPTLPNVPTVLPARPYSPFDGWGATRLFSVTA